MPAITIQLSPEDYDKIQQRLASGESVGQMLGVEVASIRVWESDVDDQLGVQSQRISGAETVNQAQADAITALKAKDQTIEQTITGVSSDLSTQKNRIAALETADAKQAGEVAAIKTLNGNQDNRLTALEQWKAGTDSLNGAQGQAITALQEMTADLSRRLKVIEQAPTPTDYQPAIIALQESNTTLGQMLDVLSKRLDTLEHPGSSTEEPQEAES